MQVTLDIPDPLYLELQMEARQKDLSVQEVAALRLKAPFAGQTIHRVSLPLVRSDVPGTMDLHRNLNDVMFDEPDAA